MDGPLVSSVPSRTVGQMAYVGSVWVTGDRKHVAHVTHVQDTISRGTVIAGTIEGGVSPCVEVWNGDGLTFDGCHSLDLSELLTDKNDPRPRPQAA